MIMMGLRFSYPERFEFCCRCKNLQTFLGVFDNNNGHGKFAKIICSETTMVTATPMWPFKRTTCEGFRMQREIK